MTNEPKSTETCYICAEVIEPAEQDRDHVFPRSLFNKEDRQDDLIILPTHKACNGGYSQDDEYFRFQITTVSYPEPKARKLWKDPEDEQGRGPVLRGFHRPGHQRFKEAILKTLIPVEVHTEAGLYLGSGEAMTQDQVGMDRLVRVVNRMVRGVFTHQTGEILPKDWPVQSAMMEPSKLDEFRDCLNSASSESETEPSTTLGSGRRTTIGKASSGSSSTTVSTSGESAEPRSFRFLKQPEAHQPRCKLQPCQPLQLKEKTSPPGDRSAAQAAARTGACRAENSRQGVSAPAAASRRAPTAVSLRRH